MITIRDRNERGRMDLGWLNAHYSFSFAGYQDPAHMGFGPLRVINEDYIAGGGGFPTHGHANFEIISYILDGALEHKDSMGHEGVIRPGEIQHMSAGRGVEHSEFNPSAQARTHLLQIWLHADKQDIEPVYNQMSLDAAEKTGALKLMLSPDGRGGSLVINQDALIYTAFLDQDDRIEYHPDPGRLQWVQIAKGALDVNGKTLRAGDGAAIQGEEYLTFDNAAAADILLFDMGQMSH